jgi:hypothetical protein
MRFHLVHINSAEGWKTEGKKHEAKGSTLATFGLPRWTDTAASTYVLSARPGKWSVCPWEANQVDAIVDIIAGAHWTEVEENAGLYRAVYL